MRKVLFISFYFPPRNQVASYRPGCFAKYLPESGWLPVVVCEDFPLDSPNDDPDFVEKFPREVEIVRIANPRLKTVFEKIFVRKLLPYWTPHHAPHFWWRKARKA